MSTWYDWNAARFLADISHTFSKVILIWAIHSNKSAEGVSLMTQVFYLIVFCARYLFFPLVSRQDPTGFHSTWNLSLKIFYIASSAYIIWLMMRVYARTRERERAWKIGAGCLGGSLFLSPFVMLIFKPKASWSFPEYAWTLSIILESVAVLPQLLLLRQTSVPTVIDSFYLVTLGSYRAFYLLNWLIRAIKGQGSDPASVTFGLIQTAFYIDFAWVYWTRQRVKLRGGTVVDSDDLSKSWIVNRIIGQRDGEEVDDVEVGHDHDQTVGGGGGGGGARRNWGPRGISVSADEGVRESEEHLAHPDNFEDEIDEHEVSPTYKISASGDAVVGNGNEWQEGNGRR